MTARTIQAIVGVLFILSHIAVLCLIAAFYIGQGFTYEEMTTTISIVAPVFAGYTLIIVRAIMAEQTLSDTAQKKTVSLHLSLALRARSVRYRAGRAHLHRCRCTRTRGLRRLLLFVALRRARARGSASPLRKRTSHIRIVLSD